MKDSDVKNILVLKGSDIHLFLHQVDFLRKKFPGSSISVLVPPYYKDLIPQTVANNVLVCGYEPSRPITLCNILSFEKILTRLYKKFDCVVTAESGPLGEGGGSRELFALFGSLRRSYVISSRLRLIRLSLLSWVILVLQRTVGRWILNFALILCLPCIYIFGLLSHFAWSSDLKCKRLK
jgi:hypothetical protein